MYLNWFRKRESQLKIVRGHIHAPYFIFIRCGEAYSDDELLGYLGIEGYAPDANTCRSGMQWLYITSDDEWVHIADDWRYSFWSSDSIRDYIAAIGKRHDVFACSVADTYWQFEFEFYRDGELRRRFSMESESDRGFWSDVDFGKPLPAERPQSNTDDPLDYVLELAASVGVNTRHRRRRVRSYSKIYDAWSSR